MALLTVAEVAARLKLTEKTIRHKIADEGFPVVRLGAGSRPRLRVAEEALDEWLGAHDSRPLYDVGSPK